MADPAETHAERLAWEMESWKSIDFQLRTTYELNELAPDPQRGASKLSEHYIETAAGQRMFEVRMTLRDGREMRSVYYSDGERCADFKQIKLPEKTIDSVRIKREFWQEGTLSWRGCPEPLKFYYCGLRPLPEALKAAQYLGSDRHRDRDGDAFLISKASGHAQSDIVLLLDKVTSVPLKVSFYRSDEDRAANRPHSVWSAESVDEVGGRHLPMRSEDITYSPTDPGKPALVRKMVVEAIYFDRDYPASTFWPTIGSDTQVVDLISNKVVAPSKAKAAPPAGPKKNESRPDEGKAITSSPIRAAPGGSWGESLPGVSIAFGVVLLAIGAGVWWRRR